MSESAVRTGDGVAEATSGRKLRVWEVTALSVGFMGPVMAMALNGIGVAGLVGKSVPFTFLLAFIGTLFVGYGFIRLTSYFSHAGSVYALAGATIGPRAGFFGGFALLGTYLFFAACILGATGVFFAAWAEEFGGFWTSVPWLLVALVVAALVILLNVRESRIVMRILFVIGAVGIAAMLVLAVVIFVKVGSGTGPVPGATIDLSTFLPGDATGVGVLTASVFAFLSWAGFESGSSLGEETENPKRAIPRALLGAIIVAGVLYAIMMFAQTIGYGTDPEGIANFAGANSTLTSLSTMYISREYAMLIAFIAFVVAFASVLSSTAAAARLVYALARDGFGPKRLGVANPRTKVPVAAVITTVVIAFALAAGLTVFGGTAFDVYYWYATIATLCMVVAYGMTSVGAITYVLRGNSKIPKWEIILPILGLIYLAFVYAIQVIGQEAPYTYFPWIAGAWCLVGLVIILARPGLAQRIGSRLTTEDLD
ncbi:amino acid transporter [Leucobacter exalbidus]|uniref:Amino acid transporter n=1 Tax=Leucobacter exalbidus TaxID=662960 RepID=A0A940PTN4_9MICO|nr:APC family permease [Leucobacter exalbidus]MBP1326015.1 amino acid transporter [Leucobacter exalbidus]